MNSWEAPTEMLKLCISPSISLLSMNSRMSGWCTSMTAMFAPSRFPPWVTSFDTDERCRSTEMGPHAWPCVVEIPEPLGLMGDSANPVPPPNFWTMAISLAVVIMPSIVSSRPMTKQAERVPVPVPSCRPIPAFISVGEFGTKSSRAITS